MAGNISIAAHALPMHKLKLLTKDEILLIKYMNWSPDLRGFPFNKIAQAWILF